jgi:flagellar biosynthesis/type III secretory pathway chaperone
MALVWDKFINVMSEILENYQTLLTIGKEKRQILTGAADVEELTQVTKKEELLVLKINRLEGQRQAVVKEIAELYEKQGEPQAAEFVKSVSEIKKLSGEKYAGRIEQLSAELKECIDELKKINELNSKLISQYLEFIEFNINVLSAASCEQTYSGTPQNNDNDKTKRRTLFNTEA